MRLRNHLASARIGPFAGSLVAAQTMCTRARDESAQSGGGSSPRSPSPPRALRRCRARRARVRTANPRGVGAAVDHAVAIERPNVTAIRCVEAAAADPSDVLAGGREDVVASAGQRSTVLGGLGGREGVAPHVCQRLDGGLKFGALHHPGERERAILNSLPNDQCLGLGE